MLSQRSLAIALEATALAEMVLIVGLLTTFWGTPASESTLGFRADDGHTATAGRVVAMLAMVAAALYVTLTAWYARKPSRLFAFDGAANLEARWHGRHRQSRLFKVLALAALLVREWGYIQRAEGKPYPAIALDDAAALLGIVVCMVAYGVLSRAQKSRC